MELIMVYYQIFLDSDGEFYVHCNETKKIMLKDGTLKFARALDTNDVLINGSRVREVRRIGDALSDKMCVMGREIAELKGKLFEWKFLAILFMFIMLGLSLIYILN
jgi:hypothetical protein